jgi:hypothetical protein
MITEKVMSHTATTPAPARELTDWFPAEVKPVHVGWYHTLQKGNSVESSWNWWWSGEAWFFEPDFDRCIYQDRIWRGLKEPA